MQYDLPNYLTYITGLTSAAVASTANGASIDLQPYIGDVAFRVDAGNATAGTSPTLDIVFKESTDNGNWTNANVSFTQITNGSSQVVSYDTRAHGRYVRLDKTIGGTNTPSFPVSVVGVALKQYDPT